VPLTPTNRTNQQGAVVTWRRRPSSPFDKEYIMTASCDQANQSVESAGKPTGRKKADLVSGIALTAFSAYIILQSLKMPITAEYSPGPGMFPLGLGLILLLLSISLIWDGINPKKADKASKFQNRQGLLASGLLILGLAGYAAAIATLGYVITTFLLVLFLMGVVVRDKIKTTVLTAICVTLLLYLIFDVGLKIHLPQGPFGF